MTEQRNEKLPSDKTDELKSISNELVTALNDLGLPNYQARAFAALSALGKGVAREIAELASIPRARVYDTLSQLEEKNLVRKTAPRSRKGGPQHYRIIPKAVEKLADQARSQVEGALEKSVDQINQLKNQAFRRSEDDSSPFEVAYEWSNILPTLEELVSTAIESLCVFLPPRALKEILPVLAMKVHENELNLVVLPTSDKDADILALSGLSSLPGENNCIHRGNSLSLEDLLLKSPVRGVVIDHRRTFLIIQPEGRNPFGLVMTDSGLAEFLENLVDYALNDSGE